MKAWIRRSLPPAQPVPESITIKHGRYVAQGCQGCHGPQLSGGKVMPFEALAQVNDVDAEALFLYLKSLPARPAGQR